MAHYVLVSKFVPQVLDVRTVFKYGLKGLSLLHRKHVLMFYDPLDGLAERLESL